MRIPTLKIRREKLLERLKLPADASIDLRSWRHAEYIIGATSYAPAPPFNGSGNIRMTFQAMDNGESILDLETKLYDYPPLDREPRESLPILHTTIDGTVTIIPEFSHIIILAIILILATMLTLIIRKYY